MPMTGGEADDMIAFYILSDPAVGDLGLPSMIFTPLVFIQIRY